MRIIIIMRIMRIIVVLGDNYSYYRRY